MKSLFDQLSVVASLHVTKIYSTSFYKSVSTLDEKIRDDVHAIYAMVRLADEIVDSFHGYKKEQLLADFKEDTYKAIVQGISLNPILNAFQAVVHKYQIDLALIATFFRSMEMDLKPMEYTQALYEAYILGSAEVVGLMCLKIFVYGEEESYLRLKPYAMKLGSAFQKINFLRDLKDDWSNLGRLYFPTLDDHEGLTLENKLAIEEEIEEEFLEAYQGILMLPKTSRFGVYIAYTYYYNLLKKIKAKTVKDLMSQRIRIPNYSKYYLYIKSYLIHSFNAL
ncbi:phytoene/squalene synthase family protein [Aureispira anguillae]|uniref:Phytoene/squalene synthase family protein n=1 Tax=Aureispira anguillae TaxID=2864201 RepID=A0A915YIK2_9BACT|nr:phytoene/squalene synthase family protein [Aureispira anguillae]BDS13862.1 phytoene/squalene synthase family protein [Aureispira anguillae]